MKSIGQQAKEFRESRGWTWVRMSAEVSKNNTEPVSRQLIKQLEDAGDRKPRYLRALAVTMGISTDALLAGLYSPPGEVSASQPAVEEPQAPSPSITPAQAINVLAQALQGMEPASSARAATLLSNLANDPAGPWADFLVTLFARNVENNSQIDKSNETPGKHPKPVTGAASTIASPSGEKGMSPALTGGQLVGKGAADASEVGDKPAGVSKPGADSRS